MNHEYYMKLALKEAEKAFAEDEVPVGAIVVMNNKCHFKRLQYG